MLFVRPANQVGPRGLGPTRLALRETARHLKESGHKEDQLGGDLCEQVSNAAIGGGGGPDGDRQMVLASAPGRESNSGRSSAETSCSSQSRAFNPSWNAWNTERPNPKVR
jgi:hypothetical protein